MDGEIEDCHAAGDMLMYHGVKLKQAFGGTGYNNEVRYFQDFAARMYFMEEEKEHADSGEAEKKEITAAESEAGQRHSLCGPASLLPGCGAASDGQAAEQQAALSGEPCRMVRCRKCRWQSSRRMVAHRQRRWQSRGRTDAGRNAVGDVLDVGQGNAVLVEQGGAYMLIDGGNRDYSSFVVSYLKEQGVEELAYVIASHYDADHLNGVVGALHAFLADRCLLPIT